MFEDDAWDIDEDYLKDFNADEIVKGFQNDNQGETQSSVSQNVDGTQKSNSSRLEFNCSVFENSNNDRNSQAVDTSSRKTAVLNIFNNSNEKEKDERKSQTNSLQQLPSSTSKVTIKSKKNLLLQVFKDNEKSSVNDDVLKPVPVIKSVLKISEPNEHIENENKLKRKKNVAFVECVTETNAAKKICISELNQSSVKSTKNSNFEQIDVLPSTSAKDNVSNENSTNDSRKKMLLDLLKSPNGKISKNSRSPNKNNLKQLKQAVVRKFPGPAGLLPDDVDDSEVIDLDNLDENKNKNSKYTNVCSQNTKNLFTTGAWQLMSDDLPADFELHDIATIKENAFEYHKTYKKVPYFAGIVQYIDYKPNDPHIILKDLSGKIDARIHHSICKMYPNALGTNVVILAKDVGLLVTSKKYVCVIISPKNLISMYSDEARLVETSHLENLVAADCNVNGSQISILDEVESEENNAEKHNADIHRLPSLLDEETTSKNHENESNHEPKKTLQDKPSLNLFKINEYKKNKQSITTENINKNVDCKEQSKISEQINDAHDFDFNEDDSWLGVNIDLDSFKAHEFPSSTPMDKCEENTKHESPKLQEKNKEMQVIVHKENKKDKTLITTKLQEKNENISKTLKSFVRQPKVKPKLKSPNSTLENSDTEQFDEHVTNSCSIKNPVNNDHTNTEDKTNNLSVNKSNKSSQNSKQLNSSVRMKLSAFRHKDALSQPTVEETHETEKISSVTDSFVNLQTSVECDIKKSTENQSGTINDNLFSSNDNDTDDEMLSQLDVDAIAASYI